MKKLINKYLPKIIGIQLNSLYRINKKKAVIKVYRIFCTPRGGKVKPHQELFLRNAKATKINHGSIQLQTYHWKNDGPTLLLIHGWDSNTSRWKDLIELLNKQNFNIIAFDAPAQGYSGGKLLNVPLYSKCVAKMIKMYKPKFLVGHSMGGMSIFFNEHQQKSNSVEKIVSLGAPAEMKKIIDDLQKILGLKPKLMKDVEEYFTDKFEYKFVDFATRNFVKSVHQECLIIHDKYDKVVPFEAGKALHQQLPNSNFIETEGAGHSLNRDYIHQHIIDFLAR